MGLLTFVDAPEIPADLPACWLRMKESELGCHIIGVGIDQYRYQMMRNALEAQGFVWDKKYGDIYLLRPSNEMQVAPIITSEFVNGAIAFGDNPLMRWAVWNSKMEVSKVGNITYGKIEPHSRKTDPFKAYVAAECVALILAEDGSDIETEYESEFGTNGVMTF
jgi:phage terminase large subunit-like protein